MLNELKVRIINTNYVFDHKLFKLWFIPTFMYGILLIFKTSSGLTELQDYENLLKIISNCVIFSGIILVFINMIIYFKIGELVLDNDILFVEIYNGKQTRFELTKLDSITLVNKRGKFYTLTIGEIDYEVILDEKDLEMFREVLTRNQVVLKNKSTYFRVLKLFK